MEQDLFRKYVEQLLVPGRKQTTGRYTRTEDIQEPKLVARSQIRPCELCGDLVKDPCTYIMTNQLGPGKKPKKVTWVQKCLVCKEKFPYNIKNNK